MTDVVTPRNQVRPKRALHRRVLARRAPRKRVPVRKALLKRVLARRAELHKKAVAVAARRVVCGVEVLAKKAVAVPRKREPPKRVLLKKALRKRVEKAIVVAAPGTRSLLVFT